MSDPLLDLAASLKPDDRPDKLKGALNTGIQFNPDDYAKAIKTSATTGVVPTAILRDPKAFEPKIDHAAFVNVSPKTADWLVSKMDNAAIAHDDLEVLSGLESASEKAIILARNAATVQNRMAGGRSEITSAAARVNKGTIGQVSSFLNAAVQSADLASYSLGQLINVVTGPTSLDAALRNITSVKPSEMDGLGSAYTRNIHDPMTQVFESGTKSRAPLFVQLPDGSSTYNWKEIGAYWDLIAENAPQLAVQWGAAVKTFQAAKLAGATDAVASVNAAAVSRPIEFAQTVGEEYESARKKDIPMAQGLLTSAASATAQTMISQGIPGRSGGLDALLFERLAKSTAAKKGIAGVVQRGLLGAVKEGTEEMAQEGVSVLGQRTYDPNAFQGAGGRILTAGIGGALVGGPIASIAFRDNIREISDLASQSKLKARDAEAFAGFMKGIGGEAFIDADRLTTFFQENGIDPVQGAEMVGSRNYAEAVVAGTDAVVSVADLVSKLKPEQVNALADDLRVAQGELSAREVEDYEEQSAKVDLEKDAAPVEAGPRQTIMEGTYRQLVDAGMAPRVAEVYADRHARVMENLAKDYGQDPIALNERYGLRIMRAEPGLSPVDAVLADGTRVDLTQQSGMEAYLAENPDMDPLFWQGKRPDIKIVDSTSYQGARQGPLMGPDDQMIVARDAKGNDVGKLWVTVKPDGFETRKIEVDPSRRREGIATSLKAEANLRWGKDLGGTDTTPEGQALRESNMKTNPQFFEDQVFFQAPVFYSALQVAIPGMSKIASKDGLVAVDQAKSWLAARQKEGKFKQAELDAVGLPEWLDLQKGKVSVDDIKAFVEGNGVQIQEVMKGEIRGKLSVKKVGDEWVAYEDDKEVGRGKDRMEAAASGDKALEGRRTPTKFETYVLPGGTNYRELLLTLPSRATQSRPFDQWLLDTGRGELASITDSDLPILRKQYEGDARNYNNSNDFQSSHWDEKNILSHIRFNERTDAEGKKVLFIEEIQSDWGQKGKKEGFTSTDPAAEERAQLEKRRAEIEAKAETLTPTNQSEGEYQRLQGEADKIDARIAELPEKGKVPSAPFVTDTKAWVALSIKRMVRYAAENGFDKVAFVNGEQSAERYDLSKQISEIRYKKQPIRGDGEQKYRIDVLDKSQHSISGQIPTHLTGSELADYVGKDLAQKIVDQAQDETQAMTGLDLKVGGEGMKAFYDKIVPSVANEVLKKLGGGRVEPVALETKTETRSRYSAEPNGDGVFGIYDLENEKYVPGYRWEGDWAEGGAYEQAIAEAAKLNKEAYPTATSQLGFDITPEMKAKVMEEGQTLFQPGDGSRAARMAARMRKLARTTRAAMDKNMAEEHLTNEAEFAAFDEAVKDLQSGDILDSKRGFIQFSPERKVSIAFLEQADLTTFIHETGHMYLEVAGDLAQENPESEGAQQYAKILSFLDVADRSELTRDHHEKFATAMEAYAMEGKAPTQELRSAFQRVKYWMLHVYRSLSALNVRLNDEIRGVFDRMIAGEDAVSGAEKALELRPMFASAEDMSATQAEYEAYSKMAGKATMTAREAVEAKLMRELMREREANWKEEAAKVAEEVAAELETDPGYVALRTLTQGEDGIKLSKQALLDAGLTQEELNALPRSKSRVYGLEGGMDLQSAAEVLGFRSGDELLTTLRELKLFRERVKEITEARMKAEHGDLMGDGSIADEAIEAVHNGHYADFRMAELRVLERMKRQAKPAVDAATKQVKAQAREAASSMPPIQSFRDTAREIVDRTAIRDLQPHRYLQARVKASKDAAKAYTALDFEAASEAKRREILNHFLFLEASKAREESTKIAEYARNATDKKFLGRLGKAGGDYLGQWLNLAGRYDFTKISKAAIDQNIQEWAKAKEAEGIIIDPILFDEGRVKNWREIPMVELRAIHDALVNIETVARRSRMVLAGDKQVDFEVAVQDLTSQAYGNFKAKALPLDPETRSLTDKAISYAKKWNADLLKFEEVVDRLDKGDINGPWRRYIFEPMALAQYREFELNRKMTLLLNEAMEQMPKKMRHSLLDEVTLEGIGTVKRKWLVSMAMNTGNDSNQTKLLKGMGLSSFEGMDSFGKALDKLTREEWVFVQKTWDALESMWPEIAALEKRMTGLEPPKIERTPFTVTFADGSTLEMQGGYFPVAYDPKRSGQGAMQAEADIMSPEGLFKGPVTFKGHTKERVENFSAPMLLDFEQVLSKHVPRVVKDISHREAAMSVAKLLNNQDVRRSVQETLGPEYEAMMMPWLQGTVNDPAGANTELMSWLGKARSNLVVASLAFRASSVLVQVVDPMRAMIGEHAVKPQYLLGATAKLSADVAKLDLKTIREIRAMSGEMAGRAENLDRDLRSMWKRNLGKEGFYAEVQRAGMKGLAVADALTSTVVWLGAYDQVVAEGSSKAEAIRKADRVVRLKLMTGAAKDLTALQRSPDMASKLVTTYMGDAVSVYGMMSRSVHNVANGEKIAASAFAFLMAGMILPVIADAVKGKMPDDDEDKAAWALKKAAFGLPSSIPLIRDIAGSMESGYDYSFSPIASQIAKIPKFAKKYSGDKDIDGESLALDLVELIGGFAGLPGTGQTMTTLRYLKAVESGKKPNPKTKLEKAKKAVLGSPAKGTR